MSSNDPHERKRRHSDKKDGEEENNETEEKEETPLPKGWEKRLSRSSGFSPIVLLSNG
jgi:hypothetical protein